MRVSVNDIHRAPLGRAAIDEKSRPASALLDGCGRRIDLHWEGALDEQGRLHRCPLCGCREIFKRYDFPQRLGLMLVIATAAGAVILLILWQVIWAMLLLLAAVVVDRIIYVFTGQCLVCYRCRSEFRDLVIDDSHEPWDLAIGEKYRPVRQNHSDHVNAPADRPATPGPIASSPRPADQRT